MKGERLTMAVRLFASSKSTDRTRRPGMKNLTHSKVIGPLLIALVVISMAAVSVGAKSTAPAPQAPQSIGGGTPVVLRYDPTPSDNRVPPPQGFSQLRIQSATITVNYLAGGTQDVFGNDCYTWPSNAQTAFNYAANIWESLINSSVPITIEACWTELAPDILGQARPADFYMNFPGAPVANTWYAASLANALSGTDLNAAIPDMHISYSRLYDFYFGTDGNTPGSQVDFASVALHEICHGLGFLGSMIVSDSLGYWGWSISSDPAIYDRFTEEGDGGTGTPLLNYSNGSAGLGSALTSQDVFFDGTNANAANGGSPPELYAPSTWVPGSSYSHLDESYNGTQNALMTWSIGPGESEHSPGPVASGILKDVGWTIGTGDEDTFVYLPLVLNNYDPNQLLQNGNFDTGIFMPWQIVESPELTDQVYHSAPYSARLAGRNDVDSDYVVQEVTVPSDATEVTMDFWYRVSSTDPSSPEDFMCVEIINSDFTTVLVTIMCRALYYEPQGQWISFQRVITGTELTPLSGQTVFVSFQGWTNATDPSTAWVDDVSFKVTRTGP
jgi:hypothetical protein